MALINKICMNNNWVSIYRAKNGNIVHVVKDGIPNIISRTRVVEIKKEMKFYIENENIEKSNFTSSMDFILDTLYKINKSLKNTLKKWINYLK